MYLFWFWTGYLIKCIFILLCAGGIITKVLSLISCMVSQRHTQDSNWLWQNQGSFMPAVSHQCHPSAASVSCNSVSPELHCKSVSCCSNVKICKAKRLSDMPALLITQKPGMRKHMRLIHLQGDECHYLHLPLLSQIKATAILKWITANSLCAISGMLQVFLIMKIEWNISVYIM